MSYSQKYCLVAFLTPQPIGTQFTMNEWPLHITLADVFAVTRNKSTVDADLARIVARHSSITTHATDDATLGETKVVLMEKTVALEKLHIDVVETLEQNGAVFNSPQFTRQGFLPHCTIQKSGRLHTGDVVSISELALVDMFVGGDWQQRKVLATFPLT